MDKLNSQGGHILVLTFLIVLGGVGILLQVPNSVDLIKTCLPVLLYAMTGNSAKV